MRRTLATLTAVVVFFAGRSAMALDKQGSGAHGGAVSGADSGFGFSGAFSLGVALDNPSYAARPDNSGLTLMRYAVHADIDLVGRRLSIPLDINIFSDRLRKGVNKLGPTEFDAIAGITTTWPLGPGALELGVRVEHDSPVDQGSGNQRYVDVRARWLFSLASVTDAGRHLKDGDVSGWVTLGWFAYNPSYFARPDNTGNALLRYSGHAELSIFSDVLSFAFDGTMFTDREAKRVLQPTELDFTEELIFRKSPWELHIAYEQDHPLDRGGLVQSFVYALVVWGFDLHRAEPLPLEMRNHIPSP